MQHAGIKDKHPFRRSQATILKNTSKPYLERIVTQDAILTASPVFPDSEHQPAHRITSASLHLFPPQGPEDHLQAHKQKPKAWNIHID